MMNIESIKSYVEQIASVCDHAESRDFLGFSKSTAQLGHILSSLPIEAFDDEMIDAAKFLVSYHRKQLSLDAEQIEYLNNMSCSEVKTYNSSVVHPMIFDDNDKLQLWAPKKSGLADVIQALIDTFSQCSEIKVDTGIQVSIPNHFIAPVIQLLREFKSRDPQGAESSHNALTLRDDEVLKVHSDALNEEWPDWWSFWESGIEQSFSQWKQDKLTIRYIKKSNQSPRYIVTLLSDEIYEFERQSYAKDLKVTLKHSTPFTHQGSVSLGAENLEKLKELALLFNLSVEFIDVSPKKSYDEDLVQHQKEEERLKEERRLAMERRVHFDHNELTFTFAYDKDVVAVLRRMKSKQFDRNTNNHIVTLSASNYIANCSVLDELINDHEFILLDECREKLEALKVEFRNEPTSYSKLVEMGDKCLLAKFDFDYSTLNEFKETIPQKQRHFISPELGWKFDISSDAMDHLQQLIQLGWHVDQDTLDQTELLLAEVESQRLKAIKDRKRRFELSDATKTTLELDKKILNDKPYDFQYIPLEYSLMTDKFFIGDTMGLGKTIETLALIEFHQPKQALVIGPNIAAPNWVKEISSFMDIEYGDCYRIANVSKIDTDKLASAKCVVVHYEILAKVANAIIEHCCIDAIVVDESHRIKHENAKQTKAAEKIKQYFNPKHIWMLSGTILSGKPKDLINQLKFIDVLDEEFDGFYEFTQQYCDGHREEYGYKYDGSSNEEELNRKLRETCLVRRNQEQVGDQLPTKRRNMVVCEMSAPFIKKYQAAERDLIGSLLEKFEKEGTDAWEQFIADWKSKNKKAKRGETPKKKEWLSEYITKRVEITSAGEIFVLTHELQKIVAQSKVQPAIEHCLQYLEGRNEEDFRPMVVFSYRKDLQNSIYEHLANEKDIRVGRITANMNADQKIAVQDAFEAGEYDVIVCSLLAANTNISLPSCNHVLISDLMDRPEVFLQAENRALRITSRGDFVDINYLVCPTTVDDDVWARHAYKIEVMGKVMDGEIKAEFDVEQMVLEYSNQLKSLLNRNKAA